MKIKSTIKILLLSALASTPALAVFDVQAAIGYANIAYVDNGSPTNIGKLKDNSFKGASMTLAAHLNVSFPLVLSLGVGPYMTTGPNMSYSAEVAGIGVTYANSQFTIGGEVYVKVLAIPAISPYAKFGFGSDSLKSVASSGGVSVETNFSGTGYRALAGLELPILPLISLFAEGGVTGSSYDVTVITISGLKAKSTGYLVNFGVSLNL